MMTDSVADCLTRIRNAIMADREYVEVLHSNLKEALLNILKQEGYLTSVEVVNEPGFKARRKLVAGIRYNNTGKARLQKLRRVSRPGLRQYTKAPEKLSVRSGLGMQIISTSKGLMTDRTAMEQRIGGEVLAEVW